MQIQFHPGSDHDAVCDLLAVPVFEGETGAGSAFEALDRATGGIAGTVLASGEFKTELHKTCLIHRPQGLQARALLLIGAGRRQESKLVVVRFFLVGAE